MVAPLVLAAAPAVIGGIAKIGAALISNSAQKRQYKLQLAESIRQGKVDDAQIALAERMIEIGLATQIDAQGNITSYDQATNTWKVVPTEVTSQLINASNDEILRQFNYDAPMARGEAMRNSARRAREGDVADGMLADTKSALQGVGQRKAGDIAGMLRSSREQAVNQGFDEVGASVATQALRSGANGAGAAAQLAKARAQAIAQTMGTPELEGIQLADDLNTTKIGNKLNNYSAVAGRAAQADGFSAPGSVAPALNQTLQSLRSGANGALGQAGNGLANAGQANGVPTVPNSAGLVGALNNAGQDLFRSLSNARNPTVSSGKSTYSFADGGGFTYNSRPIVSGKGF